MTELNEYRRSPHLSKYPLCRDCRTRVIHLFTRS